MEKYYLVIIQNDEAQAIYKYDSYNEALAAYHNELAYRAEERTSTRCAILNSELVVVMYESYIANATPNEEPQSE